MEFREVMTKCAELWIEREKSRPRGVKLPLSDKEIARFLEEAQQRDDSESVWAQIDELLSSLNLQYPLRARKLKSELKWLRKMAHKRGLTWGRR